MLKMPQKLESDQLQPNTMEKEPTNKKLFRLHRGCDQWIHPNIITNISSISEMPHQQYHSTRLA
jgi:hypothetical protein